jgi:hypothetical protein
MPATQRSTRLWIILAFVAGMVFAVALAQTVVAAHQVAPGFQPGPVTPASSGDHDPPVPGTIPDTGYMVQKNTYGLVYICPGRKATISI